MLKGVGTTKDVYLRGTDWADTFFDTPNDTLYATGFVDKGSPYYQNNKLAFSKDTVGFEANETIFPVVNVLLDLIYPVGIWIAIDNIDPNERFGGVWVKHEGVFLYGADATHPVGSTGGEEYHTLTVDEIPSHEHTEQMITTDGNPNPLVSPNGGGSGAGGAQPSKTSWKSDSERYVYTKKTGGGLPHNNMPPYIATNMWQRIA